MQRGAAGSEPATAYWTPRPPARAETFLPAEALRLEDCEPATSYRPRLSSSDRLLEVRGGQARPQAVAVPTAPASRRGLPPPARVATVPTSYTSGAVDEPAVAPARSRDRRADDEGAPAQPRSRTASGSSPSLRRDAAARSPGPQPRSHQTAGVVEPQTSTPAGASAGAPVSAPADAAPQGPLRIDAPPEVAMAAYPLVRRVALQQDLKGADRVLRVGLGELTNATTCRTWFIGADDAPFSLELHSEPAAEEQALISQVVASAQPRASGRLLVVPVFAGSRVVALALLARGESQPAFAPADLLMALVVVQETAGFIVQLLVDHSAKQRDLEADKKSIYNPEALASQRSRGNEGGLINIQPRWVRVAYPVAVLVVLAGIIFAVVARVPTYSAGAGVITIEGIEVTSPSPGTVAAMRVTPGQAVRAGEELARLLAQDEESALAQADREYRNALATLLFDGADEATKAAVAAASATRQRAVDRLEARVIRAPKDGVVGDVRVRGGAALAAGDHVLTLLRQDAEPTVLVFLPGQDRPRLRRGQPIQIDLTGYTKVRERGTIVEVGTEVIGPNEARRALGQKNADAVPLSGPVVMVRATLPTRNFKVNRDTFRYHDGMKAR
ncbi:MAG: HlyD family efflux transporter periplasmic adaptor subunit, partial [Myxococcales bacterium]|nr:HlyD family efflux transporter periplasmic adaptor subunit [Myxococcales bacterium]